jgi:hypothetical protein
MGINVSYNGWRGDEEHVINLARQSPWRSIEIEKGIGSALECAITGIEDGKFNKSQR